MTKYSSFEPALVTFFCRSSQSPSKGDYSTPTNTIDLIDRVSFDTKQMWSSHKPRFHNANKLFCLELMRQKSHWFQRIESSAPSASEEEENNLIFTRVRISRDKHKKLLLEDIPAMAECKHEMREDTFSYNDDTSDGTIEFYMNFAHMCVFTAYGGSLLAQDELQVLEMPLLGSLREALQANKDPATDHLMPFTVDPQGPSPIIIRGAERLCNIRLGPSAHAPRGIYGNLFASASQAALTDAVEVLVEPKKVNIVAMEAPHGRYGNYSLDDFLYTLATCYTGFKACVQEASHQNNGQEARVRIHTGNWGTGAYGGNRVVMALIQMLAAEMAGVSEFVFHTFSPEYSNAYRQAHEMLLRYKQDASEGDFSIINDIFEDMLAKQFKWGTPDGN